MLNKADRLWAFAILFISGWNIALPDQVADFTLPRLFTPVQLIHGIFINEVLLMVYLGFLAARGITFLSYCPHNVRKYALFIAGFGCLGLLSNAINFLPLKEIGDACRYFLIAVFFLLCVGWAKKYGPTFIIRTLLLGIFIGGAINIHFTFSVKWSVLEQLPFLLGQNGPGAVMGLAVVLSAWLMLERKTRLDASIALASGGIGLFGSSISYSRLAMLMAGFGLIAWAVVLWRTLVDRRSRNVTAVMLVIVVAIAFVNYGQISQYGLGVKAFIEHKFASLGKNVSIDARWQYLPITAEILMNHPIFGVGSGGFYDAAVKTESYRSPRATEEDSAAGAAGRTNPHNSFLYYASANGLPGLLLAVLLFIRSLQAFWRPFSHRGSQGRVLWGCLAAVYVIYGMTLPSLFNGMSMYLPVAFAMALGLQVRPRPSLGQAAVPNAAYLEARLRRLSPFRSQRKR